jgi:hypothetical protein
MLNTTYQPVEHHTIDATTPTLEITPAVLDAVITVAGSVAFGLAGMLLANYMMLPFGD